VFHHPTEDLHKFMLYRSRESPIRSF
jgi:hypothetical protein